MEERIERLEAENQRLKGELAIMATRVVRLEDQVAKLLLTNNCNTVKSDRVDELRNPSELQQRLSTVASELNNLVPIVSSMIQKKESSNNISLKVGGGNIAPVNLNAFPPGNLYTCFNGMPKMVNQGYFYSDGQVQGNGQPYVHQGVNREGLPNFMESNSLFSFGPNSMPPNSGKMPAFDPTNFTFHGSPALNRNSPNFEVPQNQNPGLLGNPPPTAKYVPPSRRPKVKNDITELHRAETLKTDSVEVFPPLNKGTVEKNGKRQSQRMNVVLQKLESKTAKAGGCRKLCEGKSGHPCGQVHDSSSPCPPCMQMIPKMKLKCNHTVDVLCHRKNKIAEICSECDSKSLAASDSSQAQTRQLTLGVDPLRSPDEMALLRFREVLGKFNGMNIDQIAQELAGVFLKDVKYIALMAQFTMEKALAEMEKAMTPFYFASLVAKITRAPVEKEPLMFRAEVLNLVCEIFAVAFKLSESPNSVKMILQRKNVASVNPKRRNLGILKLIGELYNQEVLHVLELQHKVIIPLLDSPTDENLDYLCKLLTLVGAKLDVDIFQSADPSKSTLESWYNDTFLIFEKYTANVDISASTRQAIQNIVRLKQVGWDKFKLQSNDSSVAAVAPPPIVPSPKKSKQRKKKAIAEDMESVTSYSSSHASTTGAFTQPLLDGPQMGSVSNDLEAWINAPWGEHSDPLSVVSAPVETSSSWQSINVSNYSSSSKNAAVFNGNVQTNGQAKSGSSIPNPTSNLSKTSRSSSASSMSTARSSIPASCPTVSSFFPIYCTKDNSMKKSDRQKWITSQFQPATATQRSEFLRDLSQLIVSAKQKGDLAAMGHLIDIMVNRKLITHGDALHAFSDGIISNLPVNNPETYIASVNNTAFVLVTLFNDVMQNLSWVANLAEMLRVRRNADETTLVKAIVLEIHKRVKDHGLRKLWVNTSPPDKTVLQYVPSFIPTVRL